MNAFFEFPWFSGTRRTDDTIITERCGDHVHLTLEQEQLVFETLGVNGFCENTWKAFVKRRLSLPDERAMKCSLYAHRKDGRLHRFGWVRSEIPRGFSQAETTPSGHLGLVGKTHDRERMSGDLRGTYTIKIIAVQLRFGLITFLPEAFPINVLVPAAHVHVPPSFGGGNEMAVCYGSIETTMPIKVSNCRQPLVHLHAETYAKYMAAVEENKRQQSEDESFATAAAVYW